MSSGRNGVSPSYTVCPAGVGHADPQRVAVTDEEDLRAVDVERVVDLRCRRAPASRRRPTCSVMWALKCVGSPFGWYDAVNLSSVNENGASCESENSRDGSKTS